MSFSIRNLETLLWISRLGSFGQTAKRLRTTQPAISMRIRELERHLGVKLLDRAGGKVRLTDKGRECVATAERIVSLASNLQQSLSEKSSLKGHVRVGVAEAIALSWLPALVSRLNAEYPGIVVELDIGLSMQLWQQLDDDEVEVAIVPGPISRPDVNCIPLGSLEFKWMASPDLDIPEAVVDARALENWPAITLPKESNLYYVVENWFATDMTRARSIDVCNSLMIAAQLAAGGVGITLLPPKIFQDDLQRKRLRILPSRPELPPTDFFVATKIGQAQPLARIVAELAAEVSTFD